MSTLKEIGHCLSEVAVLIFLMCGGLALVIPLIALWPTSRLARFFCGYGWTKKVSP